MTELRREPSASSDQRDIAFTLALIVVALLPRLFVAIAWAKEPVWDGHYYHFGAERIAAGLGYSEDVVVAGREIWKPWCHYPVGYSALLGAVYRVFGSGLSVAPLVNALLGTALVAVSHRLARHYLSTTRARVAGALVALHPGLIAYSAVVMTEGLAALLLILAPLAARAFRRDWLSVVIAGALIGAAALVRPSSLLAAPLLVLVLRGPLPRSLIGAAAATAMAFVMILPWTLRNCKVMDGCALVSTNGGWNLAIGALTETGRFRTLRAADGCPAVTGQVAQDRCWARVGRAKIAADPLAWLRLIPKKLGHTYDHESFAIEYLREADPTAWPEERRVAGRRLLTLFHRLLLIAAAFGVVGQLGLSRKRWRSDRVEWLALALLLATAVYASTSDHYPFFWLAILTPVVALIPRPSRPRQGPVGRYLLGLIVATSITHAIFFGDDRYHLVVTPALCLLAAAAFRRPKAAPNPAAGET